MKYAHSLLAAALFFPAVTFAQAPRTFKELVNLLVAILDMGTGILIVGGIVIYFFGISTGLMKHGEEDRQKLRTRLVWGLLVIFLMVSVWGIIQIIQNTLFGASANNPSTGEYGGSAFGLPSFE